MILWRWQMDKPRLQPYIHAARTFLHQQNRKLCMDAWHEFNLKHILENDNFWKWPASLSKHQAHYGGLALHTAQVCAVADSIVVNIVDSRRDLVFTACLWHDIAKLLDYEIEVDDQGNYEWRESKFKQMERHLVRSYADFRAAAQEANLDTNDVDFVAHLMLAHHGRREWGSPVEPQCAEAWAVHAADMLSGRFLS